MAAGRAPLGSNYNSLGYAGQRTIETYTHYDIHYPGEERLSPQPAALPTYYRLRDLGCSFGESLAGSDRTGSSPTKRATHGHEPLGWAHHNWSRAIGYEHLQTRAAAGLFDETHSTRSKCADPAPSPSSTASAPITSTSRGPVVYTQCLNQRGGIECDFTVNRIADERFLIITGTAFGQHDISWLSLNMPEDGSVSIEDVGSPTPVSGCGDPKRTILEKVTSDDVSNDRFSLHDIQAYLGR